MMMSAIIATLVGMVLGQRFKVLILAPAFLLTIPITLGAGIAHAQGLWAIGSTTAAAIGGLQLGYLIGTGIRHLMAAARANRLRSASIAKSPISAAASTLIVRRS